MLLAAFLKAAVPSVMQQFGRSVDGVGTKASLGTLLSDNILW
ncbi:hypothetical protein [Paracoccus marcusii]|nr:hypothetical protein [Paracoccus marcusii]